MLRRIRVAILLGVTLAAVAVPASAQEKKPADTKKPAPQTVPIPAPGPAVAGDCGSGMMTVAVQECVPETYTTKRIAHKQVCTQETYQTFRCETVPVTKTRTVTCYVRQPVVKPVVRTVCERVPCVEERTVMRPHYSYVNETVMKSRRVDRGYWECVEVPDHFRNFCNGLRHRFGHRNDCCEPCPPCPATRTVKRWHACWTTECYPCTVCRKVCEMRPEVCRVTVCRTVTKQITCNETTYVCVPQTRVETYTCCETRQVPCTATRNVVRCVPYEETVTCCRMVSRTVYRQVPAPSCCETECTPCCGGGHGHHGGGLLSGLFNRGGRGHHHGGGCSSGCADCGCH